MKLRGTLAWGAALAAVLLTVVAVIAYERLQQRALPETLGGLPLATVVRGDAAGAMISRMHRRWVTPRDNMIGLYRGPKGNAALYLSEYGDTEAARDAYERMAKLIAEGSATFSGLTLRRQDGVEVSSCEGMGQTHYFFPLGRALYWLSADSPLADRALASLLREADS